MAHVFNLAAVGDTMTEGDIVEWYVSVGDEIKVDQLICSIETDKSVVELSSPFAGIVLQLGADVGGTVAVGETLIAVGTPDESAGDVPTPSPVGSPPSHRDWTEPTAPQVIGPLVRRLAEQHGIDAGDLTGTGHGGRVTRDDVTAAVEVHGASTSATYGPILAMPKVRRDARSRSIDLNEITGTGPRGSVTTGDLDRVGAVDHRLLAGPSISAPDEERVPMSRMRRTIAANLTRRWQEVPHVSGHTDADASALLGLRAELGKAWGTKVPIDALLLALCVPALREFPSFRARVDGDDLVIANRFDIGLAVDTAEGLVVPVIRSVDERTVSELSDDLRELAERARARQLSPSDLRGSVFTISNLGPVGLGHATSITPDGTSALLSLGRATPGWVDGPEGEPRRTIRLPMSITVDHRAIDGADAGRFLTRLVELVEHPISTLLG